MVQLTWYKLTPSVKKKYLRIGVQSQGICIKNFLEYIYHQYNLRQYLNTPEPYEPWVLPLSFLCIHTKQNTKYN